MSDADALMWNIEKDPVLRSTIVAVAVFDRPPDWDRLRRRVDRATRTIPRLRQRVLSPPLRIGPPRWSVDPAFDLGYHLRRVRLPAPGDDAALLAALEPVAAAAFDRARPLWEFTLIEGLAGEDDGERAALAMKVHHSVTDGVGGMALLSELVDLERDPVVDRDVHLPDPPAGETPGAVELLRDSADHTRRRLGGMARRAPASAARTAAAFARAPGPASAELLRTARSVARALAPATSPLSPLMRERGLGRRLARFDVPLDDLRRVAKAAEGSVNDVFVAAVVGGIARYHARHGAPAGSLRMTLPVNLRSGTDDAAGNRFAPARFAVPADISDPAARVRTVRALVRGWRAEPALQLTSTLAGVLNRLPTAATTALFGTMLKCCDFVATNVPGAPVTVYAAGARVDRMYAFAPPSGAALNVALISHCDTCCIGVVVDTAAVPDHHLLVECLEEGFAELLALA
jgi:WS/DGAT/MGAT family acyltransferase